MGLFSKKVTKFKSEFKQLYPGGYFDQEQWGKSDKTKSPIGIRTIKSLIKSKYEGKSNKDSLYNEILNLNFLHEPAGILRGTRYQRVGGSIINSYNEDKIKEVLKDCKEIVKIEAGHYTTLEEEYIFHLANPDYNLNTKEWTKDNITYSFIPPTTYKVLSIKDETSPTPENLLTEDKEEQDKKNIGDEGNILELGFYVRPEDYIYAIAQTEFLEQVQETYPDITQVIAIDPQCIVLETPSSNPEEYTVVTIKCKVSWEGHKALDEEGKEQILWELMETTTEVPSYLLEVDRLSSTEYPFIVDYIDLNNNRQLKYFDDFRPYVNDTKFSMRFSSVIPLIGDGAWGGKRWEIGCERVNYKNKRFKNSNAIKRQGKDLIDQFKEVEILNAKVKMKVLSVEVMQCLDLRPLTYKYAREHKSWQMFVMGIFNFIKSITKLGDDITTAKPVTLRVNGSGAANGVIPIKASMSIGKGKPKKKCFISKKEGYSNWCLYYNKSINDEEYEQYVLDLDYFFREGISDGFYQLMATSPLDVAAGGIFRSDMFPHVQDAYVTQRKLDVINGLGYGSKGNYNFLGGDEELARQASLIVKYKEPLPTKVLTLFPKGSYTLHHEEIIHEEHNEYWDWISKAEYLEFHGDVLLVTNTLKPVRVPPSRKGGVRYEKCDTYVYYPDGCSRYVAVAQTEKIHSGETKELYVKPLLVIRQREFFHRKKVHPLEEGDKSKLKENFLKFGEPIGIKTIDGINYLEYVHNTPKIGNTNVPAEPTGTVYNVIYRYGEYKEGCIEDRIDGSKVLNASSKCVMLMPTSLWQKTPFIAKQDVANSTVYYSITYSWVEKKKTWLGKLLGPIITVVGIVVSFTPLAPLGFALITSGVTITISEVFGGIVGAIASIVSAVTMSFVLPTSSLIISSLQQTISTAVDVITIGLKLIQITDVYISKEKMEQIAKETAKLQEETKKIYDEIKELENQGIDINLLNRDFSTDIDDFYERMYGSFIYEEAFNPDLLYDNFFCNIDKQFNPK